MLRNSSRLLSRLLPARMSRHPRRSSVVRRSRRYWSVEELEGRVVLSVTIAATNNNALGYAALSFNQSGGWVPPDSCGAAGPSSYVETVNQAVALYGNKATGAPATTAALRTFWFTTGGLARADSSSNLSDPIVAYNDQIGRFIIGDQDVNFNTHVSTFDIAVSKTSDPATLSASDWTFYQVKTTESGYDADYPGNFGYNHDAFVFTLNMYGVFGFPSHALVVSISNVDLAANVAQSALHVYKNDVNDFSLRPTVMRDSVAGDPMWLVTEHGDGSSIDVIKDTNVLSTSSAFTYTNLAVAPYSTVVYPRNPNGTVITNNIDSRIMNAAESNKMIVAAHSVAVSSTQDDAQWYAIDVSNGTPVLKQQGRVGAGDRTYITYPTVDINKAGQIGMTYMQSGNDTATDYMSMYITGRDPSDPAGTMEPPVLVPAGQGVANYDDFTAGGRAGDLSGINVDPVDGSFWAVNEFANTQATANWGTAVANFTIGSPLPSTDMAVAITGPSSVTAGTNATYTVTITNNGHNAASGVVLSDALPAGSSLVSITQTAGIDAFTRAQSGSTVTETATASIASGNYDTFSVVISVPSSLANGANFSDTASVLANNPDPDTTNNSATVASSVVNSNPDADLSVSTSGPATSTEGNSVTYTVQVTNSGPADATNVTLTDTLAGLLSFQSATATQGSFSASGGVVTFTIGTISAGATVTATVTAQALEDGSASATASVTATSPDPSTANNSASVTTSFAEPAIVVSRAISTKSQTLTNYQVATFTHANGFESPSVFRATINWGDGTTSAGNIGLSGTTYTVTGSHTYTSKNRHTITTTVTEAGNAVDKYGDSPGGGSWKDGDVVHLPQGLVASLGSDASAAAVVPATVAKPLTARGALGTSIVDVAVPSFKVLGRYDSPVTKQAPGAGGRRALGTLLS